MDKFKAVLAAFVSGLWTRVIVNYKPTLVGMAIGSAIFALDFFVLQLQGNMSLLARFASLAAIGIGSYLKGLKQTPAVPVAPTDAP